MATPRRRLCTSGRGAQLRLGTFAPGGSTSSPLWVWGTPLRLSGLFLVRRQSLLFASKPLLTYVFSPGWLNTHVLSPWHPVRVTGRSCVSEVMSATCHACNGIPWVPCDTTFKLAVMHFSWWRQQRAGSITLCDDMMELNIWRGVITIIKQNHASQRLSKCSKSNRLPQPLSLICEESLLMCRLIC